jgi:hypothetical protein
MFQRQRRFFLLAITMLTLMAPPAWAYEILLDIDTDNDPTTINNLTNETSAVVKVILSPTTPGESIGPGLFGLGGSCLECDQEPWTGVYFYGTSFDMRFDQPWVTAPGFSSAVYRMTLLGCADDPGYHTVLWFEPIGGTLTLNQPIFLGQFNAWVSTVPDGCPQPASNLAAMPTQGEVWNYIQLGGAISDAETVSWGQIKAVYR